MANLDNTTPKHMLNHFRHICNLTCRELAVRSGVPVAEVEAADMGLPPSDNVRRRLVEALNARADERDLPSVEASSIDWGIKPTRRRKSPGFCQQCNLLLPINGVCDHLESVGCAPVSSAMVTQ